MAKPRKGMETRVLFWYGVILQHFQMAKPRKGMETLQSRMFALWNLPRPFKWLNPARGWKRWESGEAEPTMTVLFQMAKPRKGMETRA